MSITFAMAQKKTDPDVGLPADQLVMSSFPIPVRLRRALRELTARSLIPASAIVREGIELALAKHRK